MIHQGKKVLDNTLEKISNQFQREALQIRHPANPESIQKIKEIQGIKKINEYDYELELQENANPDTVMKSVLDATACDSIEKHRQTLDEIFRSIVSREEINS